MLLKLGVQVVEWLSYISKRLSDPQHGSGEQHSLGLKLLLRSVATLGSHISIFLLSQQ